ncbi:MerR family transcriptional regulator [Streptomyces sp. NPDC001272]
MSVAPTAGRIGGSETPLLSSAPLPPGDAAVSTASDHDALSFGISTGAVARRQRVSPTTVRSWEHRYGSLPPAGRGHAQALGADDVAMLDEMCRLTTSGIPPAEAARTTMTQRRLKDAHPRPGQLPQPLAWPRPEREPGNRQPPELPRFRCGPGSASPGGPGGPPARSARPG